VVSSVQRDPDVTHLIFGFAEMTTGVPAALKNAGLADKVKIITAGPEQPTFQSIINGEIAAATAQPLEEQQWCMADALARFASGTEVPPVACDLPSQILQKDTVPEAWKVWPGVPDWKNEFLKDWEVS
jgi:ABC-type sugar transport system substrate-binding protein